MLSKIKLAILKKVVIVLEENLCESLYVVLLCTTILRKFWCIL